MAKTSNVFARVEPGVKEQAEEILDTLGIPMSNAVNMFLKQVVLQRGIPFDIKIPSNVPLSFAALGKADFDEEIKKGMLDIEMGRVYPQQTVDEEMRRDYGL